MNLSRFFGVTDAEAIRELTARWLARTRRSIVESGVAPTKHVGGKVPDNPAAEAIGAGGVRARVTSKGKVPIERPVTAGFTLVVKHPGFFTALLPELAPRWPVFAVVRNPLSVLSSWSSLDFHLRDGRAPAIEKLDPALVAALDAIPDPMARQLRILEWFFDRYARLVDPSRVLRYEELISSGGRSLAAVVPAASSLAEDLKSRNRNELYAPETMRALGERLLAEAGSWRKFYEPASVEALLR
jgi:hypothetical protein